MCTGIADSKIKISLLECFTSKNHLYLLIGNIVLICMIEPFEDPSRIALPVLPDRKKAVDNDENHGSECRHKHSNECRSIDGGIGRLEEPRYQRSVWLLISKEATLTRDPRYCPRNSQ